MDDLKNKFPLGTKVSTIKGPGNVAGYLKHDGVNQVIISFNQLPWNVVDDRVKQQLIYAFDGDMIRDLNWMDYYDDQK
jgi:hypothetical protein